VNTVPRTVPAVYCLRLTPDVVCSDRRFLVAAALPARRRRHTRRTGTVDLDAVAGSASALALVDDG
jgi:hypothetical protein